MNNSVLCGDALSILKTLPDESVQCCVTSPPYWGLRDYQTKHQIWPNSLPLCEKHDWEVHIVPATGGVGDYEEGRVRHIQARKQAHRKKESDFCSRCGAWRGSFGLEPTPELYVKHAVEIFREVRRVLRKDGTLWLNIGDSYASGKGSCYNPGGGDTSLAKGRKAAGAHPLDRGNVSDLARSGLKPKDLVGIPWMLAFALRADGWYLRSDIVWEKPNPMPESVVDRPTRSHEYIFLLTKAPRYFYDQEAIREPGSWNTNERVARARLGTKSNPTDKRSGIRPRKLAEPGNGVKNNTFFDQAMLVMPGTRNKRSVWTITTQAYPEAHFATFPEELPRLCIAAGTSEVGCCPKCGAPWERLTNPSDRYAAILGEGYHDHLDDMGKGMKSVRESNKQNKMRDAGIPGKELNTTGWTMTCDCYAGAPVPCVVLDPFSGSGTTLEVAARMGRRWLGIELSEKYVKDLIEPRMELVHPLFQ